MGVRTVLAILVIWVFVTAYFVISTAQSPTPLPPPTPILAPTATSAPETQVTLTINQAGTGPYLPFDRRARRLGSWQAVAVVNVTVTNLGDSPILCTPADFHLSDKAEQVFDSIDNRSTPGGLPAMTLRHGEQALGDVTFLVPYPGISAGLVHYAPAWQPEIIRATLFEAQGT